MSRGLLVTLVAFVPSLCTCKKQEPQSPPEPERIAQTEFAAPHNSPSKRPPTGTARPARYAGSWYPADATELQRVLDADLATSKPLVDARPLLAIVSPHAGERFSGQVAGAVHGLLRGRLVTRVWLLGPSHHARVRGAALPAKDVGRFATPLGELPLDRDAVEALRALPGFDGPPEAHRQEHSLELNAIFLARTQPGVPIVPLLVGDLGDDAHVRALADRMRPLLREGDAVVVSGDFTHYGPNYGYAPFAAPNDDVPRRLGELADAAAAALGAVDLPAFSKHLDATHDTICGREPLRLLMALLPPGATGQRVAFDTSGRVTSDYTNSVTYVGLAFQHDRPWGQGARVAVHETPATEVLDAALQAKAIRMVRRTLEVYLTTGRTLDEAALEVPPGGPLHEAMAAFVTLKKSGELRGCIGHTSPVQALWLDLRDNAIAAAVHDGRFSPVTAAELPSLSLEVSVLTPPVQAPGPEAFEVGRHGVILHARGRSAVFLPQVAPEQGWDRETTYRHLAHKAGLALDAWRDPDARFLLFEAQVFDESVAGVGTRR